MKLTAKLLDYFLQSNKSNFNSFYIFIVGLLCRPYLWVAVYILTQVHVEDHLVERIKVCVAVCCSMLQWVGECWCVSQGIAFAALRSLRLPCYMYIEDLFLEA